MCTRNALILHTYVLCRQHCNWGTWPCACADALAFALIIACPCLGVGCRSLVSQSVIPSVTTAIYADDSDSATSSLPPIQLHPGEPRMHNATRTRTRSACSQGISCSIRPALPLHVKKKKRAIISTVPSCTVHIYCGNWPVGGGPFSSSAPKRKLLRSQYRSAPVVGPSQRSQPWNQANSICTYGGTTDSCRVQ